jgi:hypothetical protein
MAKNKLAAGLKPERINIRVTHDERVRASVVAERLGLTVTELIRRMLAGVITVNYTEGEQLAIVKGKQIVGFLIGL